MNRFDGQYRVEPDAGNGWRRREYDRGRHILREFRVVVLMVLTAVQQKRLMW